MSSDLEHVREVFSSNEDAHITVVSRSEDVALTLDDLETFVQTPLKYSSVAQKIIHKLKFVVDVTVGGRTFPMEIEGNETLFPNLQASIVNGISSQFAKISGESDISHMKRQAKMLGVAKALDTIYDNSKGKNPFSYDPNKLNRVSSKSACGFLYISDEKLEEVMREDKLLADHHDYASYGTENGVGLICPHRDSGCERCIQKDKDGHQTEDHYLMWRVESLHDGKREDHHGDQLVIVMPNFVYGTFQGDNIAPLRGWISAAVSQKLAMMTGMDIDFYENMDVELDGYGDVNLDVSRASNPNSRCAFDVGLLEAFAFTCFRDVYEAYVNEFKIKVCEGAIAEAGKLDFLDKDTDVFVDYVKKITNHNGTVYIPARNEDEDGEVREHDFLTGID